MMTTFEFLSYLRQLDVKVWADGDKLRYQVPRSGIPSSLLTELAQRKPEILRVLGELEIGSRPASLPLRPIARGRRSPLSFSQQRLWFLDQLVPNNPFYNESGIVRIEGGLDLDVLERVINEIVRRHEVLRTKIEVEEGTPVQVTDDWEPRRLERVDLSGLTRKEREAEVLRIAEREARTGFDLSRGPLIRVQVLRLEEQQHILLLTMHHIVSDGWSSGILIGELRALYQAYGRGAESPLEELPIQYADFAVWQREWLKGEALEEQLAYWRKRLAGMEELRLPTDYLRPAVSSYRGARLHFQLPADLSLQIQALNRSHGTTLFMCLVAAFNVLLHRYTGEDDLVIGTDVAGRDRMETERLIGFFANLLVLRTDLSGNPGFAESLRRVRETVLEAYAHRELPFELLVAELQGDRNLGHAPIVQVLFTLQNFSVPKNAGLNLSVERVNTDTSKFDLAVEIGEHEQGLSVVFEYNTDLFEAATIHRLFNSYRTLLTDGAANPARPISRLQVLTAAERQQVLVEWNQTDCEFAQDQSWNGLFEAQVTRTPEAVAVVFHDRRLTYRELNARAGHLAQVLLEQGVGPEVVVALLAERGIDFLVTMLAIFKAGGTYLPLDPYHPAKRIGQVLGRSGAGLVVTASQFGATVAEAIAELAADRQPDVLFLNSSEWGQAAPPNRPSPPHQLVYMIFTSGSTGVPKGAMVEQRGMLNHLFAKIETLRLDEHDVVAQTASQCFDISLWQFLASLLTGGQVCILDDEIAHDPTSLLDQIERQNVTIVEVVPSMMRMMLAEADRREVRPNPSMVRWLIPTGEALPPELAHHWLRLYPQIPLLNAYGPTECSDDVTHYPIDSALSESLVHVPIGRPIINTQIYILNAELQPQPIGVAGELYISGVGVGRGYLGEAGRTSEVFVPDPFANEAGRRLYKSGDLARYLPDGNLEFLGRIDHQVKIRGFRIELGEIEARLGRHPALQAAIVLAREDHPGEKRLAAYLVARPEATVSIGQLRDFLRAELPEYMVPAAYVMLEALPLTENGKLDRRALPIPETARSGVEPDYVAPRTPAEQILAGIWSQVLGLDRVGRNDNFFDLGGHSLLATQAVSRVRGAFQVELPLKELFEHPTVSELAAILGSGFENGEAAPPPLTRVSRDERLQLSFAQQRLWFMEQLDPGNPVFNCHGALRLDGLLNLHALGSAIDLVVSRHEVLRTRIELHAG
ncbi:MAG TPA: amino acid adenylation domain-containing protein, partial [Blastocatellia bacterium]|nr:amino acid adenylation domain-containing protein [Blastocatellia bacterium]